MCIHDSIIIFLYRCGLQRLVQLSKNTWLVSNKSRMQVQIWLFQSLKLSTAMMDCPSNKVIAKKREVITIQNIHILSEARVLSWITFVACFARKEVEAGLQPACGSVLLAQQWDTLHDNLFMLFGYCHTHMSNAHDPGKVPSSLWASKTF